MDYYIDHEKMRVGVMGNRNPRLVAHLRSHPQVKVVKRPSESRRPLSTVVVTAGTGTQGELDAYAALAKGKRENPQTRLLADFIHGDSVMPQHPHSRCHAVNPEVITSAITSAILTPTDYDVWSTLVMGKYLVRVEVRSKCMYGNLF